SQGVDHDVLSVLDVSTGILYVPTRPFNTLIVYSALSTMKLPLTRLMEPPPTGLSLSRTMVRIDTSIYFSATYEHSVSVLDSYPQVSIVGYSSVISASNDVTNESELVTFESTDVVNLRSSMISGVDHDVLSVLDVSTGILYVPTRPFNTLIVYSALSTMKLPLTRLMEPPPTGLSLSRTMVRIDTSIYFSATYEHSVSVLDSYPQVSIVGYSSVISASNDVTNESELVTFESTDVVNLRSSMISGLWVSGFSLVDSDRRR
nr:hypothetical protein [Tanacetum cinerariifolium]